MHVASKKVAAKKASCKKKSRGQKKNASCITTAKKGGKRQIWPKAKYAKKKKNGKNGKLHILPPPVIRRRI